jgi:hypothetical protein
MVDGNVTRVIGQWIDLLSTLGLTTSAPYRDSVLPCSCLA